MNMETVYNSDTIVHNVIDFDADGHRSLAIHITGEGLIVDLYDVDEDGNDILAGSSWWMFDQLADDTDRRGK